MDIKAKLYAAKTCDNDLIAIPQSKETLMLKKLAYVWMCILDLGKVDTRVLVWLH